MTAPLFHGDAAAASTPAALRRFDEETPVWSVGSVDPGTGVWTPHRLPALIVLAPHPDDEVLGAAPLIVAALRAGAEVVVVAATDGEGSHAPDVIDPAELAAIRRRESEEAAEVLAAPFRRPGAPALRWVRLALPDGSLAEREDDVVRAIEEVAASLPPESWLVSTLPHDGHPDHEACGRAAERAAARNRRLDLVHVPVWLWHHRRPGDAGTAWDRARTIPVDAEAARAREAALARFRSQRTAALGRAVDRPEGAPVVPDAALEAMFRDRLVVFPAPAVDFTALYGSSADPWAVEGRWYEQRKFELTMAVLPRRRFGRAFEPACSTGWLTARLAERCDRLVATDLVPAALDVARERVRAGNVVFAEGSASDVPEGPLDLVVLSEVGYYLSGAELAAFLERARAELAPDGVLVAAHWRHAIAEAHRTGDEVHRALAAVPGWERRASYADDDVLIELFGPPAPSVAEAEFLAEEEGRRGR